MYRKNCIFYFQFIVSARAPTMAEAIENARGLAWTCLADAQVCTAGTTSAVVAEGGSVLPTVHRQGYRADTARVFATPALASTIPNLLVGFVPAVGANLFFSLTLACGADHGPSFFLSPHSARCGEYIIFYFKSQCFSCKFYGDKILFSY